MKTIENQIGKSYNRLTVIEHLGLKPEGRQNKFFVRAKCVCGKEIEVTLTRLARGGTKSCGCLLKEHSSALCIARNAKFNNLKLAPGRRFGKLIVIEDLGFQFYDKHPRRMSVVKVQCDCGKVTLKPRTPILGGNIKSCGCALVEHGRALGLSRAKIPGVAAAHASYCAYTKSARNRELEWGLTETDFITITSQQCFYCGALPSNVSKSGVYRGNYVYNGIDRIHNDKGYVPGNCIAACFVCNRAKSNMKFDAFMDWIEKFRRPRGDVEISRIVDKHGRVIPLEEAVRREWLAPKSDPLIRPYVDDTRNLWLDQGRQITLYAVGFRSPISDYTVQKFGVGTGLTPARVTDVALQAPIVLNNGNILKTIDAVDFLSPFTCRFAFTLATDDANGYLISELGLFSGGNAIVARKVRAVSINKTSDFSPTCTWRVRF